MKKIFIFILMIVLVSKVIFAPDDFSSKLLDGCLESSDGFNADGCSTDDGNFKWEEVKPETLAKCAENPQCADKIEWGKINLENIDSEQAKKILLAASSKNQLGNLQPHQFKLALEVIVPGASVNIGDNYPKDLSFSDSPPTLKRGEGNNYPLENVESLKIDGGNVEIKYRGGIPSEVRINNQPIAPCKNCDIDLSCTSISSGQRCTLNVVNGPAKINDLPSIKSGSVTFDGTGNVFAVDAKFAPCEIVNTLCALKISNKFIQIPDKESYVNMEMGECDIEGTKYTQCLNVNDMTQDVRIINKVCRGNLRAERCKIVGLLTAGKGGITNANIGYYGHVNVPEGNAEYEDWTICIETPEGKCAIPLQRPSFTGRFTAIYNDDGNLRSGSLIGHDSEARWGDVNVKHRKPPLYFAPNQQTDLLFNDARPDNKGGCKPEETGNGCAQFWPNGVRAYANNYDLLVTGAEGDASEVSGKLKSGSVAEMDIQQRKENPPRKKVYAYGSCWDSANCADARVTFEDSEGHNYIIKFKKDGTASLHDSWRKTLPPDNSLFNIGAFNNVAELEAPGKPNDLKPDSVILAKGQYGDEPGGYFFATRCRGEDCPASGYNIDVGKSNLQGGICSDKATCQEQFSKLLGETGVVPCSGTSAVINDKKIECDPEDYNKVIEGEEGEVGRIDVRDCKVWIRNKRSKNYCEQRSRNDFVGIQPKLCGQNPVNKKIDYAAWDKTCGKDPEKRKKYYEKMREEVTKLCAEGDEQACLVAQFQLGAGIEGNQDCGPVDNNFGRRTKACVRRLQSAGKDEFKNCVTATSPGATRIYVDGLPGRQTACILNTLAGAGPARFLAKPANVLPEVSIVVANPTQTTYSALKPGQSITRPDGFTVTATDEDYRVTEPDGSFSIVNLDDIDKRIESRKKAYDNQKKYISTVIKPKTSEINLEQYSIDYKKINPDANKAQIKLSCCMSAKVTAMSQACPDGYLKNTQSTGCQVINGNCVEEVNGGECIKKK